MKEYDTKQFEFFRDEILGELEWCDEVDESGVDPLEYALGEIRKMKKEIKRLSGVSVARFQSGGDNKNIMGFDHPKFRHAKEGKE